MTAYKNRGKETRHRLYEALLFFSVLLMMVSLLIGRGALSIATILFLLLAIVRNDFLQQWKTFLRNPFLLLFTLLFFIPFISGLWSEDLSKWSDVVRLKLPLLFFPLAFAGSWQFSQKQWTLVAAVFIAVVFAGCCWSLAHYLQNMEAVHEGYLRAKTLLTPLENDHVRFSWLVSIAVMTCFLLTHFVQHKTSRILLWCTALFFSVYLHVLSARTGMISLYIFLLLYAGWLLLQKKKVKIAALLLFAFIALPVIAYFAVPTFQNRFRYLVYDFSFVKKAEYLPGANDGARVMSLKAGWQVLRNNPLGVGAGDVMHEADKWYAEHVPNVLPTDKFYPSSEWLLYGAFAGWMGVVLFTVVMLAPFFSSVWLPKIFWYALHATAAFSFAYDMGLEVQYGIFIYAFVVFWWWKWGRE
ncbi:MAG TPA: O-antigen ligase family protein [Flavisolibacter sp.]|jgi:O-antigen ligase|nr:O-antigen ligase family protein [Flavisolibacter sp.]